jgi:hypothetical protein
MTGSKIGKFSNRGGLMRARPASLVVTLAVKTGQRAAMPTELFDWP